MARSRLRGAVQSGNWSDPNTWNNGVAIESRDVVVTNGYNVNIDQDIEVKDLSNLSIKEISYNPQMAAYNTTVDGEVDEFVTDDNQSIPIISSYKFFINNGANNYYYFYDAEDGSGDQVAWISIQMPEEVVINRYTFQYHPGSTWIPKEFKFQAWNGSQYVDLHHVQNNNVDTKYNSGIISNTTAYSKYRFYFIDTPAQGQSSLILRYANLFEENSFNENEAFSSNFFGGVSVQGGSLTVDSVETNNQRNITVTQNPIDSYQADFIDMSVNSPGIVNFNGDIFASDNGGQQQFSTINITGDGTYNFTGDLAVHTQYYARRGNAIKVTAPATVNFVGNLIGGGANPSYGMWLADGSDGCIVNIVGTLEGGPGQRAPALYVQSNATVNITGDLYAGGYLRYLQYSGRALYINNANCSVTIAGDIQGGNDVGNNQPEREAIYVNSIDSLTITGTVNAGTYWPSNPSYRHHGIIVRDYNTASITGTINATAVAHGLSFSNLSSGKWNTSITTLSGPFVSGSNGMPPFDGIKKLNISDNTNNSIRLVSSNTGNPYLDFLTADTVVDSPAVEDVREGTTYANGAYTGTLSVPLPSQVSLGIAVDDTTGTAVLNASDVWSEQVSNITTAGSIGERLKNASTVESTGDQLESFL